MPPEAPAADLPAHAGFLARVPIAFARRHALLGLERPGGGLVLLMGDPTQTDLSENLGKLLAVAPGRLRVRRADPLALPTLINAAYEARTGGVDRAVASLDAGGAGGSGGADAAGDAARREAMLARLHAGAADLLEGGERSPVVELVNTMLAEAVAARASDVHVQPLEASLVARMRVDGVLQDTFDLPKAIQEEVVSRVKVMARMDIAEKRLPQDGRVAVRVGARAVDLRVSTLPTAFGERVVIRLLDKSRGLLGLAELGMPAATEAGYRRLVAAEHGIVLVTGPTGSGKSTTLYAALAEADGTARNILTIEDPIEYQLPGVSQTQVNVKKGLTFAGGLRSILRQDPDVIMVGEIRDRETAEVAIQAALTGHLVLSTLHTNDAASAITRLLDLGVEPYLIASSVTGVAAQRLLRRVCDACSRPVTDEELAQDRARLVAIGEDADALDGASLRRGAGCGRCRGTGFRGRTGVFEMLPVDTELVGLIQRRADAGAIKASAVRRGMATLHDDAMRLLREGVTTADELARVAARAGL